MEERSTPAPPAPSGPKVVRYFAAGPETITVKDADGKDATVPNPTFRFYRGIPARDLTEEDWAALTPEQQRLVDEGHVTSTDAAGVETRERLYAKTKSAGRKG